MLKGPLLFIAAAVAVANAREGIGDQEKIVLEEFMGESFSIEALNVDKLDGDTELD